MAVPRIAYADRTRNLPERECSVDGCSNRANRKGHGWCEKHYGRMRRNGDMRAPVIGKWTKASHGYMVRQDRSHPLAGKSGLLYQHRAVLYDRLGSGPQACHWCGLVVEWRGTPKLVVDHLDGDKANNREGNLVPSCHKCNATRGLFQRWVMDHRDDPFLWSLFRQAQAAA
jgi:hypothetical protein